MAITQQELCFQQWDAIFHLLQAEQNYGDNGPGTGTNPTGRLQEVAKVGQSSYPDFSNLPYVGVQFDTFDESIEGSGPRHKIVSHFTIVAVVDKQAMDTQYASLEAAQQKLRGLLSDGNGNGITAILRDMVNYKLVDPKTGNATADQVMITSSTMTWAENPEAKGTDYVVLAQVKFDAMGRVQPY